MKVFVIILIMCAAPQSSASFFEEFRGAMHSVQHSFGRLLTDVYADVSQTIGCTLLAVKQVLALDHAFHESSDYSRRCRGQVPIVIPEVPKIDKNNLAFRHIDSINANHELDNIEMKFKTETDRLMAISKLLKREVDNIPTDLKLKFQFDSEPQEPIGSIWQSLKILHDVEHSNKNYVRATEIHEVLDKALNIMNIKTTDTNESDDDKIKTIVKDLEKDSKDSLVEVNHQFEEWKKEEIKQKKETDNKITAIVKVLGQDELKGKTDTKITTFVKDSPLMNTADNTYEEVKIDTTTAAPTVTMTTLSPEIEAFQNLILSQFGPQDIDSKITAVAEATKLIKDSEYRAKMFENLAKAESASTDLFENPDLFINNFGKY